MLCVHYQTSLSPQIPLRGYIDAVRNILKFHVIGATPGGVEYLALNRGNLSEEFGSKVEFARVASHHR